MPRHRGSQARSTGAWGGRHSTARGAGAGALLCCTPLGARRRRGSQVLHRPPLPPSLPHPARGGAQLLTSWWHERGGCWRHRLHSGAAGHCEGGACCENAVWDAEGEIGTSTVAGALNWSTSRPGVRDCFESYVKFAALQSHSSHHLVKCRHWHQLTVTVDCRAEEGEAVPSASTSQLMDIDTVQQPLTDPSPSAALATQPVLPTGRHDSTCHKLG